MFASLASCKITAPLRHYAMETSLRQGEGWIKLTSIFENLRGGSDLSKQAGQLIPLGWSLASSMVMCSRYVLPVFENCMERELTGF